MNQPNEPANPAPPPPPLPPPLVPESGPAPIIEALLKRPATLIGALQQASSDIQKAVSSMQTQLDDLERSAAPLVQTWQGEAQQAYAARQAKWRASSQDLTQILQNIKSAVDQSCQDYISTEKQATSRFQ